MENNISKSSLMKPAWGEEDEEKCMWIVRLIATARYSELKSDKMPCDRLALIRWLKSIKYRVNYEKNYQ